MKLLDLFCGAGGAAMGYYRAGFEVVGVDIKPQSHYPFEFHQDDALEYCAEHGREFDVIHASPPCQGYSRLRHLPWLKDKEYPLLIDPVRELLKATGKNYVIENVSDAPLDGSELCGLALGLLLLRHRRFESSVFLIFPPCPRHPKIFPGNSQMSQKNRNGGIMGVLRGYDPSEALEINWMNKREMRQAIPPAYTEFIGKQILRALS